jgi:Arc/MetJ-type ribon-helix-helix transcriptional regulator
MQENKRNSAQGVPWGRPLWFVACLSCVTSVQVQTAENDRRSAAPLLRRQPEIDKMVLDRVRSGEYSSTSELVNTAVRILLEDDRVAAQRPVRADLKSLELAQDAPANLKWLNKNRAAYLGEWVALYKGQLIAHGKNGLDVFEAAQSQGINPPLMHRIVPEDPVSWGGW